MERQVPTEATPLFVGDGRVARHMCHYWTLLDRPFECWARREGEGALFERIERCDLVVALISDDAIEGFFRTYAPHFGSRPLLHFSGSLCSDFALGAHPLFTFGGGMCDLATYEGIPFILDAAEPAFDQLFPGLVNTHYVISREKKPLYHALAVLAGNFSCMLWLKLFHDFEEKLGIPSSIALPYMRQVFENLQRDAPTALTGPLTRGDQVTIARNLKALEGDPFYEVYTAFVRAYSSFLSEEVAL